MNREALDSYDDVRAKPDGELVAVAQLPYVARLYAGLDDVGYRDVW